MKLLPKEPTQEMWEKAWNSIKVNEELERVRKVLSIHEIRMLLNHFCGAMYAASPEVKDAPVAWTSEEELERGKRKKQSIVAWTEDYDDYPVALYLRPSPRIAELEDALRDMLSGWKYIREVHGDLYGVGWDRAQKKAEEALK